MRKILPLLLVASLTLLAGCESERTMPEGKVEQCNGLNDTPKPNIQYKYSARNLIVGVFSFEMVAPPIIVALNELQCPVDYVPVPTQPKP